MTEAEAPAPGWRTVAPALVAGATVGLALATLGLAVRSGIQPAQLVDGHAAPGLLGGLILGLIGALILRDVPGNILGTLFAASGLLLGASTCAGALLERYGTAQAWSPWAVWVTSISWIPATLLMLGCVPLLYPDGRLQSARWRWPLRIAVTGTAMATLGLALSSADVSREDYPGVASPLPTLARSDIVLGIAGLGFIAVLVVSAVAVLALLVRIRRTETPERARLAWFAAAIALLLTNFVLPWTWLGVLATSLAWVCLGVGVVRYQLFDIETILTRSLVYALFTLLALLAYLATAAIAGEGLSSHIGPALVTAVVALLLASARGRAQAWVSRGLFGQRDDPMTAVSNLGRRLEGTLDPDEVLPAVVDTVRESLRLPYAAVVLLGEAQPAYASGSADTPQATYPLTYGGEAVGVLVLGSRRGERQLSPADDELLTVFSGQVGVAAHAARVTRDLRRSREQLVTGTEEERRRVRRDLHDGIGPSLAGIALGIEAAARAAHLEGSQQARLLDTLEAEVRTCLDDVRRVVRDLRPAALDQLGLLDALRQHAEALSLRSGLDVSMDTPEQLPALPAAVEVAAYRIAMEALTNVSKHASARRCTVSVAINGCLALTIADDGRGVPPTGPGYGLLSMRERAEQLGGTCVVRFTPGRGTTVAAELPVGAR